MTSDFDGTYAVATIGIAGMSVAVAEIRNSTISANDISGARYAGTISPSGEGLVFVDLQMKSPPNTFAVWGTTPSETIQVRSVQVDVPQTLFEGVGYTLPGYDLQVFLRRIGDDYAFLAGRDGIRSMIDILCRAQTVWDSHEEGK